MTTATPQLDARAPSAAAVKQAYEYCAALTKAASTNFYYAFLTLPPERRRALYAVYAFCRVSDDIVDSGRNDTRRARAELEAVRGQLADALAGAPDGPVWVAIADAHARFGIGPQHLRDVIDGCEMDLTVARYRTFDDLLQYCRRVASAVGLMTIEVCGYRDEQAVEYASDLGIAFQLTNVLRDLREDAAMGRIYLPLEDMERFGYGEQDLLAGKVDDRFRALMRFQVERARRYYDSGERLFPLLDRRSRICPQSMDSVYRSLLDRIEAADYDVLSRRITLSRGTKLKLVAKFWLRSRLPFLR